MTGYRSELCVRENEVTDPDKLGFIGLATPKAADAFYLMAGKKGASTTEGALVKKADFQRVYEEQVLKEKEYFEQNPDKQDMLRTWKGTYDKLDMGVDATRKYLEGVSGESIEIIYIGRDDTPLLGEPVMSELQGDFPCNW